MADEDETGESRGSLQALIDLARHQGVAYLAVGGFNTVLGYTLYYLLLKKAGLPYIWALFLAYAIAMLVAFGLHRTFVFRVSGNAAQDLSRFVAVNLAAMGLNAALLAGAVELVGLDPLVAQVIVAALVVVATYVGHRFFSFRRPQPR